MTRKDAEKAAVEKGHNLFWTGPVEKDVSYDVARCDCGAQAVWRADQQHETWMWAVDSVQCPLAREEM